MVSEKENLKKGNLNILEYVVVCAIILYIEVTCVGKVISEIKQLYNSIVSFVHLQEMLLPLTTQLTDNNEKAFKKAYAVRKTMR